MKNYGKNTVRCLAVLVALSMLVIFTTPFTSSSDVAADWDDKNSDDGFYFEWKFQGELSPADMQKIHQLDDDLSEDIVEDVMKSIGFDYDDDMLSKDPTVKFYDVTIEFGDGESFENGKLTSLEMEIIKGKVSFEIEWKQNSELFIKDSESSHIDVIDGLVLELKKLIGRNYSELGDKIQVTANFEKVSIEEEVETYIQVNETQAFEQQEIESEIEQFTLTNADVKFTDALNKSVEFKASGSFKVQESEGTVCELPTGTIGVGTKYTEKELAEIEEYVHKVTLTINGEPKNFERKASETDTPEEEIEYIEDDDLVPISSLQKHDINFTKIKGTVTEVENQMNENDVTVQKSYDVVKNRVADYDNGGGGGGDDDDDPANGNEGGNNTVLIAGAAIGVVAIAGIAIFLMKRRT